MANVQCRKLTIHSIVDILVSASKSVQMLETSIEKYEERLESLTGKLLNDKTCVVLDYLHNLEDLTAGQFCPVRNFIRFTTVHFERGVINTGAVSFANRHEYLEMCYCYNVGSARLS
jgi:hypothetical protein